MKTPATVVINASYQRATALSRLLSGTKVYSLCSVEFTDSSERTVVIRMRLGELSSPCLTFHAEAERLISYEDTAKSKMGVLPYSALVGSQVYLSGTVGVTQDGMTLSGVSYLGREE